MRSKRIFNALWLFDDFSFILNSSICTVSTKVSMWVIQIDYWCPEARRLSIHSGCTYSPRHRLFLCRKSGCAHPRRIWEIPTLSPLRWSSSRAGTWKSPWNGPLPCDSLQVVHCRGFGSFHRCLYHFPWARQGRAVTL